MPDVMKEIGERMAFARKQMPKKVSQTEMANMVSKMIGKDPPYRFGSVSNWERGQDKPPPEVIRAWAKIADVGAGWLLHGERQREPISQWRPNGSVAVPIVTVEEAVKGQITSDPVDAHRVQSQWPCSAAAFAIDVFDASNEPEFIHGATRLIVDPDAERSPGDTVFASVDGAPVIGELREAEKSGFVVAPRNPAFRAKPVDEAAGDRIIGVVTEWATASRAARRHR